MNFIYYIKSSKVCSGVSSSSKRLVFETYLKLNRIIDEEKLLNK